MTRYEAIWEPHHLVWEHVEPIEEHPEFYAADFGPFTLVCERRGVGWVALVTVEARSVEVRGELVAAELEDCKRMAALELCRVLSAGVDIAVRRVI